MTQTASTPSRGGTDPASDLRLPAADIDASLRWPVLLLFASATVWLLIGSVLWLVTFVKFASPGFLGDVSWLTLGKVRPAAVNAFLYGCASQASFGALFWMLCRLGGNRLGYGLPVMIATAVWNLGLTVGIVAILAGGSTGFEWLEMPRYAAVFLVVAYLVIGVCALGTFQTRRQRELYPSQWFLLAALLWFPWTYLAAQYLLIFDPVRGTMQAVVNAWFTTNFSELWLGMISLAGIYYFLPRLTGQALYSRELAAFAFWTTLFLTGCASLTGMVGAPVPRWMPAMSTAAAVCLLLPIFCNAVNWHLTNCGNCSAWKTDVILRFISFGGVCYLLAGIAKAILASPSIAVKTDLTLIQVAVQTLALHGFVGSVLFGCAYYLLPRVAGIEWAQEKWIRAHFGCTVAGVLLMVLGFGFGGISQAGKIADSTVPILAAVKSPFLFASTIGLVVLFIGQLAFAANLAKMVCAAFQPVCRSACNQIRGYGPARDSKAEVRP